jgi:hypothetical protein
MKKTIMEIVVVLLIAGGTFTGLQHWKHYDYKYEDSELVRVCYRGCPKGTIITWHAHAIPGFGFWQYATCEKESK